MDAKSVYDFISNLQENMHALIKKNCYAQE